MAAAKETKMNQSNLAKILGPTIIGYSSVEALPEEIMKEVGARKQICNLQHMWPLKVLN